MSADNYLYVRRAEDMWTVTMEFASSEPGAIRESDPIFETRDEALNHAAEWLAREPIVEYGIQIERPEDPFCPTCGQSRRYLEEDK